MAFQDWWDQTGRFLDPDTSDVPWFDKRQQLAEAAYCAGCTAHGDEIERLREALNDAAEMTEHEEDRTIIYNHCKQAVEAAEEETMETEVAGPELDARIAEEVMGWKRRIMVLTTLDGHSSQAAEEGGD